MRAGITAPISTCGELWLCLSVDAQRTPVLPQHSDYTHYAFSIDERDFAAFVARLEQAGVVSWKVNKSEGDSPVLSRSGRA